MGSWVHDKVHVKSLDFFEPCAKAAKHCIKVQQIGIRKFFATEYDLADIFGKAHFHSGDLCMFWDFHPSSFPGSQLTFS